MSETSDFYNKESVVYSNKRYIGVSDTYVKFFFKKRLCILLNYFKKYICLGEKKLDLLEVGCADGVIINNLKKEFPNNFSNIVGIDIAQEMIGVARKINADNLTSFYIRGEEPQMKYDVIMAVGFLSLPMFKQDFSYIQNNLKDGGYFIWSLATSNSLHTRLKLKGAEYLKDFFTFKEYEDFISKDFEILKDEPYGLFIPKLWAFPKLARVVQPVLENLFKNIFPSLFHEKIYLLKKKQ